MDIPYEVQQAADWVKLAQAMAYVDLESLPVEEQAALGYALGVLQLSEGELNDGREHAATLTLADAVERVSAQPEQYRGAVFGGMVLVAWADGRLRDEETRLLAALATYWGLEERRLETECATARYLAETIMGDPNDAT